jgi:hypothetical protein
VPQQRQVLLDQAAMIMRLAGRTVPEEADLADIRRRHEEVLAAAAATEAASAAAAGAAAGNAAAGNAAAGNAVPPH